jgi:tRNA threonylcarbamoyl adenosine modification protein (Sua5/YciO/YrdC/YwlC family)
VTAIVQAGTRRWYRRPPVTFEECIRSGGVALFPSDTVYGLACDPDDAEAVARLYALKDRPPQKAAAVMFFDLAAAMAALPDLGERTRGALERLLPGAVTLLLPNPEGHFPLACAADPSTLGLRVISIPELHGVGVPVLQSSANLAGGHDARRLAEVPASIRDGVDLTIDGGELPGLASTVVDLRTYERRAGAEWSVVRPGAVGRDELAAALDWQFHFDPATYNAMIRDDIPVYDELQDELVGATGSEASRILELGTGTGETAARLLTRHGHSSLVGIDISEPMLGAAQARLPADRVELRVAGLQDELPPGPFDVVASALCVHHLDGAEKADLFARVREVLAPGGRFVLADVVIPADPADAMTTLSPGYDKPSTAEDQLQWLAAAGFDARVRWSHGDLVVLVADLHPR